jgi:histidinol-phosphate aminotransferase
MFNLQTHLSNSFYLVDRKEKYCYDGLINLSSNEFVHSLTEKLLAEFVKTIEPSLVARYPYYPSLYKDLSKFTGIPSENILLSAGSDDAIKMICESLIATTGRMFIQSPNYESYYSYCKMRGVSIVEVEYLNKSVDSFTANLFEIIENSQPGVVVITNPNGFTGEYINLDYIYDVASVSEEHGHILLIDEAYSSFSNIGHQQLLNKFSNIIICHSFSKSFGMCGLRIGILMSSLEIIDYLSRWKSANPVSSLSLAFLQMCLQNHSSIKNAQQELINCREWFHNGLKKMFPHWVIYSSCANFMFVDTHSVKAVETIYNHFYKNKIIIRKFFYPDNFRTCLRITIADQKIMQRVLNLIFEVKDDIIHQTSY